jgi:hypothetical protein
MQIERDESLNGKDKYRAMTYTLSNDSALGRYFAQSGSLWLSRGMKKQQTPNQWKEAS